MKRSFSVIDHSLPSCLWNEYEYKNEKILINHANELEMKCDQMFNHFARSFYGKNAEMSSITKNVRIFIRHQFIPKSIPQVCTYYIVCIYKY